MVCGMNPPDKDLNKTMVYCVMFSTMKLHTLHCIILSFCALLLAGCPPIRFSPNVDYDTGFEYGVGNFRTGSSQYEERPLRMDRIAPNDVPGGNLPCVLLVHGGGFDGGSRDDEDLLRFADGLATEGYVCFSMDYRLLGEPPFAPLGFNLLPLISNKNILEDLIGYTAAIHASFVDVKVALRHLRANAEFYGIDPNRIVVMGESAGAFGAIAAAVTEDEDFAGDAGFSVPAINNPGTSATPQAVITFWGNGRLVLDEFDANDPPFLIAHGTVDEEPFASYVNSPLIYDTCVANDIPAVFYPLDGLGHGAWNGESDSGWNLVELSLDFLAQVIP